MNQKSSAAPKTPLLFSDHHFFIGSQHLKQGKPCQDYALSGIHGCCAFAIVSDGCSSGRNTDIGARIIALATAAAIKDFNAGDRYSFEKCNPQKIGFNQQFVIGGVRQMLGLVREDLLATCVYAYLTQDGGFIHMSGDGVIAWKQKDGSIFMIRCDWDGNMPMYPIYAEDHYASFVSAQGGHVGAEVLAMDSWMFIPQNGFEHIGTERTTVECGIRGVTRMFTAEDVQNSLQFVAVFTDGITQIHGMEWKDAVVQLLDFKSSAGEFVKRRMIRFIKDAEKQDKRPVDDIALAVVSVGTDET